MKFLKVIGALFYGVIMYYLLWLLFYWIVPIVMSMGWGWFILYILIAGGAISAFVSSISNLLIMPLILLSRDSNVVKYISAVVGLFFGYSAIKLPWSIDGQYDIIHWIWGISLTITILIIFITQIVFPFTVHEND